MSEQESNKQLIARFNDALVRFFAGGSVEDFASFFDAACKFTTPGMPPDLEGMKQALPAFQAALSAFELEVGELIAEGDWVAYRLTWTATHSGDLMGVPATGRRITVTETHIERLRDGKIIEHGGDWDQLGLLQQVGAIHGPA